MGGVAAILAIMLVNKRDKWVNERCCKALNFAAEGKLIKASMLLKERDGLPSAVLACIQDFADCPSLVEQAFLLLVKVAGISSRDAISVTRAGGYAVTQMVQTRYAGTAAVELLANQLLMLFENAIHPSDDPCAQDRLETCSRTRIREDAIVVRRRAMRLRTPFQRRKASRISTRKHSQNSKLSQSTEECITQDCVR